MEDKDKQILEYEKTFAPLVDSPIYEEKTIVELLQYNDICYWWPLSWNIYTQLLVEDFIPKDRLILQIYDTINHYIPLSLLINKIRIKTQYKENNSAQKRIKIMIRDGVGYWKPVLSNSKNTTYVNTYHGGIIDLLRKYEDVDVNLFWSSYRDIYPRCFERKYKKISKDLESLSPYVSFKSWKERRGAYNHFKKIYNNIEKNVQWFQRWSDLTSTSVDEVKTIFRHNFTKTLPNLVSFSHVFSDSLKKECPSVFIQSGEHSSTGRICTIIAGKNGIPSVALQHGVNFPTSPDYTYHKKTIPSRKNPGLDFPISDITCLWGEYDKGLLIKHGNYSSENIFVSGNPRYDNIIADSILKSENIYKLNENIKGKEIILWATTFTQYSLSEREEYLTAVLTAIQKIPNTILIIKQHPAERTEHTDLIKKHLSKYNIEHMIINKSENITPYIYMCDVLIHHGSTCGQEAIIFKKPTLILEFGNHIINGGYEGVSTIIQSSQRLYDYLDHMIKEPDGYTKNYDEYILKHCFKIDDMAAQRCVDCIIKLASKICLN